MDPVGFCIGNERQEFLARIDSRPGVRWLFWVCTPYLAKVYPSRRKAASVARQLDRPGLLVVPLYDLGDQWAVEWPEVAG